MLVIYKIFDSETTRKLYIHGVKLLECKVDCFLELPLTFLFVSLPFGANKLWLDIYCQTMLATQIH